MPSFPAGSVYGHRGYANIRRLGLETWSRLLPEACAPALWLWQLSDGAAHHKTQSTITKLLVENPVLLTQVLDRLLLVPVHPAGNRDQQELERIEHSRHRFPELSQA
jgi:hypothetical protein